MANIKSQKKRNRQNERRRVANKDVRSALKTYMKRFGEALDSGDQENARVALQQASRELDKAASKGTLHRNAAANRKSLMARRLDSAKSG